MSLSDKSDYEINCMVAKILYPSADHFHQYKKCVIPKRLIDGLSCTIESAKDWINDDNLAFKLMIDNHIDLDYLDDCKMWSAELTAQYCDINYEYEYQSIHKNPNRAICETFILMSEGKS